MEDEYTAAYMCTYSKYIDIPYIETLHTYIHLHASYARVTVKTPTLLLAASDL